VMSVIPVEVAQTPWHFTTWLDLFDHWQTVIAGFVALVAALITVWVTLRVERGKAEREVNALRKSLAVELRMQITRAADVYDGLRELASTAAARPITARMVESKSRMPAPIIYSANAGKIGLLEGDGMSVVLVYTLLEGGRDGAARLMTSRTPDDITAVTVLSVADAFLTACQFALDLLPKLRTGVALHDATDEGLAQQVNTALAARGWS